MTYEIGNKLVDTIATLLDIAGCPTMQLLNAWKENPKSETLYEEIENAEYIRIHQFAGQGVGKEIRNLIAAAYHIADTIAEAETY